ncbi:MAG: ABC transporter ATP-binding protein [Lachnospiraceae bacterium]|nr:ABC transporter ATP-binding protein [Lachnospiraceae bacterium]
MEPVLTVENVSKTYTKGKTRTEALKKVSFSVNEGETIAVIGESGAGKSTLLNLLGLIDEPSEGTYFVRGKDTSLMSDKDKALLRNKEFGFILQEYGLVDYLTVEENISIPLEYSDEKPDRKERGKRIRSILETLGIKDKLKEQAGMLSGGQRQRVAIARALINNPGIVLADEPTSALDEKTKSEMIEMLLRFQKESGSMLIVVTHDSAVAERMGRTLRFENGTLTEDVKNA